MSDQKTQGEREQIVGRLNAEIQLRHEMRLASEKMEMYELFDQAILQGSDYSEGFEAGFRASRILYEKYSCSISSKEEVR